MPTTTLRSDPDFLSRVFDLPYDGHVVLMAKAGSCERLVIEGRCPSKPGEVLLHELDSEDTGVNDRRNPSVPWAQRPTYGRGHLHRPG
ncbi:MAG: hypothetical protein WKF76_07160 [Nocardioidaceae bacterium]